MKRIGVLTSGGDAPGMNACIRAVVRTALSKEMEILGIKRGYKGLIEGDIVKLERQSVSNIIQLGGTILHSSRSELFRTEEGRQMAFKQLEKAGIQGLIVIGGDGTFKGASVFMSEHDVPIVGIPGTIDNDLFGTDYTIGYDTAINTAMNAIDNIKDTAHSHDRLFFIEVMGRDAGFIALRTGIATGAEAVLIPETITNMEELIDTLELDKKKNSSIVVVAEGDDAGGAFDIAKEVKSKFKHYDIRVSILGHVQRGGRPTCMERVRASRLGMEAVNTLEMGMRGVMIGQVHQDIVYTPFERAVKHHQKINPILLEMLDMLR